MDSKLLFIMNLSKGRIGEDNSRLLGGMLITNSTGDGASGYTRAAKAGFFSVC